MGTLRQANVQISPVRLDLSSTQANGIFTLTNLSNDSDATQNLNADIVSWNQQDEKDIYSDQDSILLIPPIFSILPGKSQIVRLSLIGNESKQEQAFRVFFKIS